MSGPLWSRGIKVYIGALCRQKIAVSLGRHIVIKVHAGDGVLQGEVPRDIEISAFPIHGLEDIDIGQIKPKLIAVSADFTQSCDPHQGGAVYSERLLTKDSMECRRYVPDLVEPSQAFWVKPETHANK